MTSRDWFCLALRVLGVWQLASAVPYVAMVASSLFSSGTLDGSDILRFLYWGGAVTAVGLFLLLFSPAIATRLYPEEGGLGQPSPPDLPERLLEVGLRLLGVYLLVQAVHQLTTSIVSAVMTAQYSGVSWHEQLFSLALSDLVASGIYAALGSVVLLGPKRIIAALDRLRYDAERDAYVPPTFRLRSAAYPCVPANRGPEVSSRQFTMSQLMLLVTVLCAVLAFPGGYVVVGAVAGWATLMMLLTAPMIFFYPAIYRLIAGRGAAAD